VSKVRQKDRVLDVLAYMGDGAATQAFRRRYRLRSVRVCEACGGTAMLRMPDAPTGIGEIEREELLGMVSPEAIRSRLLGPGRRHLTLAVISGEEITGVRTGGREEYLAILGLRASIPELHPEEITAWRAADPRYELLYQDFLREQRPPVLREGGHDE
jgi:hypothetical protein